MSDLVVIAFPTEAKAEEVRQKLLAMQKEYLVELALTDVGINDKWMKETAAAIQPGMAALFVFVRKAAADRRYVRSQPP